MVLSSTRLDLELAGRPVFGAGAIGDLGGLVGECGGERVFVVTDPGVAAAGVADRVRREIPAGMPSAVFDGVAPNPGTEDVENGSAALSALGVEGTVVVAVGGGSVMDAAKAISLHAANGGPVRGLADPPGPLLPGLPLVAVPTTAGTAAETNGFGVITDAARGRKFYIGHDSVRPRRCVLDPALTLGLPPGITAATGVDAMTHALEALMSRHANPVADGFALQAVGMIAAWLPSAVGAGENPEENPEENLEARAQMLLASNLAGQAFATGTGLGLCHAIAHPLGARLGVPHGVAIAGVLPAVMRFNLPASGARISAAATALGASISASRATNAGANAGAAIEAVEGLIARVMGENVLAGVSMPGGMLATIVEDCLEDPVIRPTPRMPSAAEVERILRSTVGVPVGEARA